MKFFFFKYVRDDERCGRSKEVRTPELIGQIKRFKESSESVRDDKRRGRSKEVNTSEYDCPNS